MNKEERKNKENELDYLYNSSMEFTSTPLLKDELLADLNDFVDDKNEIIIDHDYEEDRSVLLAESLDRINKMTSMYLENSDEIINHPYIQEKIIDDASDLADIKFVQKITRMALVTQIKQIDRGDKSPKHFDTLYCGMREVRENIKQSSTTISNMESFYRTIRTDLGLSEKVESGESGENGESSSNITTQKNLNSYFENLIKQNKANPEK